MSTAFLSNEELKAVRAQFPALVTADATDDSPNSGYIYAENAGGSQVLGSVASSISSYLLNTNVQMANYPLAQSAEARVSLGTSAAATLLGSDSPDNVMIGQSATSLVASVAFMLEAKVLKDRDEGTNDGGWKEGDEIVISDADHETNRGAWTRLAQRLGLVIKPWTVTRTQNASSSDDGNSSYAVALNPSTLKEVVGPKTKLVAFTACSNLLGHFTDISSAVSVIRSIAPQAIVAVDCVAFAPHRRILPLKWDADLAFFSLYKTYGAHVGAMYINPRLRHTLLSPLNHFFLQKPTTHIPGLYPFQSSSVQYELNYSIAAVADYLISLGTGKVGEGKQTTVDWNNVFTRTTSGSSVQVEAEGLVRMTKEQVDQALDVAFTKIAQHEAKLMLIFIPFLLQYERGNKGAVRIVGPEQFDAHTRAPTVAFAIVDPVTGKHQVGTSKRIHQLLVQGGKVGAQQGHMYAHKLVQSLNLDLQDGVVRLSFVHYNTVEEVQRTVELLGKVLDEVIL
ncbi:uncharacterized protein MEPE_01347 [Melanopsichium pennsylvanicum]|uniref:Aminotransferase class V domain-containing protein n=2 Tax=Melanopsichium pennsylvanicum TaxID=63383 RepID=A0AAJ4XIK6_9BASI|nr:plp-dependent transferase [Melanopsichium pennsylvanicum 4]SNX82641.1 uncharacterized protein MEPE_01347 [Melanopsichium pennsylvanicum]